MVFSRQEYWSTLLFPSPVDHLLSELLTVTRLSRVALRGMAQLYELLKPFLHNKAVIHDGEWNKPGRQKKRSDKPQRTLKRFLSERSRSERLRAVRFQAEGARRPTASSTVTGCLQGVACG